jgi:uncharacterized lipoprotein YbaY
VAVEKIQEYAVAIAGLLGVIVGAIVVHATVAPTAFVTVHDMTPPGVAPLDGPVTIAVRVAVPPNAGVPVSLIVTEGVTCDIPRVTLFEVAER